MVSRLQFRSNNLRMHEETISPTCFRLIQELSRQSFLNQFYLVGGTALSLQLGHRKSIDLDFFSQNEFEPMKWKSSVHALGEVESLELRRNNLSCKINKTKLEFLYFAYPNHFPLVSWEGIKMLDPKDIALFKILAIIGRNRKKDIIDLYFIDKEVIDLQEIISLFFEKYEKGDISLLKQVETLFDDENVEKSDMPDMLKKVNWEEAYSMVKEKVSTAIRKQLI